MSTKTTRVLAGLRLAWCLVVASSAPLGGVGLGRILGVLIEQAHGRVAWTDFLNLYTGASLLLAWPSGLYSAEVQHAFEQAVTEPGHPYLGFFLPPWSALLVSWLGWLPYAAAYAAWLVLGLACVVGAAWLLGECWRQRLVWLAGLLVFLPVLEGLGQGQTSALMLLGVAALARGLLRSREPGWLWLAVLACLLKPQLGLAPLVALALDRRLSALLRTGLALGVVTAVVVALGGPEVLSSYRALSAAKLTESLTAPADFLPGPTLLHVMQRFFGTGAWADAVGFGVAAGVLGAVAWAWRRGLLPEEDERRLLQVALLPLASVLVAPYALVHELSCWPVAFWLLQQYTRQRPLGQALLLVLAMGVWASGALAVLEPNASRGADVAALLGLVAVAWLLRDLAVMPPRMAAGLPAPTMPAWRPVVPPRRMPKAQNPGPA